MAITREQRAAMVADVRKCEILSDALYTLLIETYRWPKSDVDMLGESLVEAIGNWDTKETNHGNN